MDTTLLLHTISAEQVVLGSEPKNININGVTSDSRQVQPGMLFVALPGSRVDGHCFIVAAANLGAAAIVCQKDRLPQILEESEAVLSNSGTLLFAVDDSFFAYAEIVANFYGRPADSLQMLAVTGTNGKTTVSYLVQQILVHSKRAVGVIGTIHTCYITKNGSVTTLPTNLTTPEAGVLQKNLREMVDAGIETVIMEVSSHALVQHRVGGISFFAAGFTNISRDHLDYHHTMEEYLNVKSMLFSHYLEEGGVAVLPDETGGNAGSKIIEQCRRGQRENPHKIIWWGEGSVADLRLKGCRLSLEQSEFSCVINGRDHIFTTPLVGRYNLENLLVAWGLCSAAGLSDAEIAAAIPYASGAPGRLERVSVDSFWHGEDSSAPVVLVDYAHTPDALEKVLECAAALPHRTLCVVFGCGGDRDGGKRPLMGRVAARLADLVVVTDDNPRTEDPSAIIAEILPGIKDAEKPLFEKGWLTTRKPNDKGCVVISDRSEAVRAAIRALGKSDLIVIAGKGHESYQITAEGKRFFDDRREAEEALFSWTAKLIARATGGRLRDRDTENAQKLLSSTVEIDSRVENGEGIFVALRGDNHDAHEYIKQAESNGCRCVVVEHEVEIDNNTVQVIVADTVKALGDMAAFRRCQLGAFLEARDEENKEKFGKQWIIGITGSCGKTTVKEMIAAILRRKWQPGEYYPANVVLKTVGNFNNAIGLPLLLLPLGVQHRAAVLEMGMNAFGEIAHLAEIAQPEMSCITNVFAAHLQGLGSLGGVAQAKGELFSGTKDDGVLVVNLDDKRIVELAQKNAKETQRSIGFSLQNQNNAALWIDGVTLDKGGRYRFNLYRKNIASRKGEGSDIKTIQVALGAAGEHNISNALAAAAVCSEVGCSLEDIAAGLADFLSVDKRMEMLESVAGYTVINDCYNANPASMAAGLKTLVSLGSERTIAIVGDMLELGENGQQAHIELGRLIAELGVSLLITVGDFAGAIAEGAHRNGMKKRAVRSFTDKGSLVRWMKEEFPGFGKGDAVFVKASRGLALETVVRELL